MDLEFHATYDSPPTPHLTLTGQKEVRTLEVAAEMVKASLEPSYFGQELLSNFLPAPLIRLQSRLERMGKRGHQMAAYEHLARLAFDEGTSRLAEPDSQILNLEGPEAERAMNAITELAETNIEVVKRIYALSEAVVYLGTARALNTQIKATEATAFGDPVAS